MKNTVVILSSGLLFLVCLAFVSCSSNSSFSEEIVKINLLDTGYPIKEINVNEIAAISYIRFDSEKDEHLFGGRLLALSPKTAVFSHRSGDIHFFSRTGEFISKFNRRGDGPEEYGFIMEGTVYDEEKDELFVISVGVNKIRVYDHLGNFKRILDFPEEVLVWELVEWDENSLLV